jgi:hypothetical protein
LFFVALLRPRATDPVNITLFPDVLRHRLVRQGSARSRLVRRSKSHPIKYGDKDRRLKPA